jgi:hypothetical protein
MIQVRVVTMPAGQKRTEAAHSALLRCTEALAVNGRDGSSATLFERAPANSALPPISDVLLSRSKGAGGSKRAIGAMMAPLSDHRRRGINTGVSLGHQRPSAKNMTTSNFER